MSIQSANAAGKNRVPKGVRTGGQFAATVHAEPTVSLASPATATPNAHESDGFPSVGDAGRDELRALAQSPDPLVRAEVTSSVRVPDDVLESLAEPDQPTAVRLAAAGTGYAGTADRAAADPHPLVRAVALTGWDLSSKHLEGLRRDPEVERVMRIIGP